MADNITLLLKDLVLLTGNEKLGNWSFNDLYHGLTNMMRDYRNNEVDSLLLELYMLKIHTVDADFIEPELTDMILEICEKLYDIRYGSNVEGEEENVVGFDEEVETLLDQLTTTCTKQLQVISIAGMAGLGKTTLARKLYKHPLIEYFFDIRAWTCVSQVSVKRNVLLGVLSSFINHLTDEIYEMSDEQLGEKLYRLLKGRKYLVVLDDIWDCKAWNDLKVYFPDDKTGSRVLLTSRDMDVSLHVQAARPAHVLRLRTPDESWKIFQNKVFRTGICPYWLQKFGRVITKKCEGLPLAIVITAGLLRNQQSTTWWIQIAENPHSFMVRDPSQYMESLALSYSHLPPYLRQCFVFVGVFPEDYDIPVTKLIWLWVAQGFIHETESRILEDIAEGYLMNLIKRSLLMTAKKRADGQIKYCRIHDLLRDICLVKAKEDNVSSQLYKYARPPKSSTIMSSILRKMSFNPSALPSHSYFCYPFEFGRFLQEGRSLRNKRYKFLRILDVESVTISEFPSDATQLSNLRYLAVKAHDGSPKVSISNLVNLQMLIISSRKNTILPKTIWNMVNLRHIFIKSGENLIEEPSFVQVTDKDSCPSVLASLQTLSQVSPQSCQDIFSRTPNLRKLGFCGPLMSSQGHLEFPNIRSLQHLQKLKLLNTITYREPLQSCNPVMFPEKLKKLTLSNTSMDWEEMWTFSLLPNLEVLKLKFHACIGEMWDTSDAEFQRLKILKLHGLNLRHWVCSRDNFPCLQRLVVHQCLKLNDIPSDLGKILTLEVIEVQGCTRSAQISALRIQEEQESEGNFSLKARATYNLETSC